MPKMCTLLELSVTVLPLSSQEFQQTREKQGKESYHDQRDKHVNQAELKLHVCSLHAR